MYIGEPQSVTAMLPSSRNLAKPKSAAKNITLARTYIRSTKRLYAVQQVVNYLKTLIKVNFCDRSLLARDEMTSESFVYNIR